MSLFGKRSAEPLQGSQAQKPSPFAKQSGGLFGQNTNSGSNMFSNSSQSTSTPNNAPSLFAPSPQTKPSLFGASAQNTTTQTASQPTNSLFGNTSTSNNTSTGLFGSPAPQTQQSNNTSLFGNNQQSASLSSSGTGNLFGSSAQSGGGSPFESKPAVNLFGNNSTSTASGTPNQTSNLFGSGTPQQPAGSTGLFASSQSMTTNLFGSNSAAKPNTLFGSPSGPPTSFGSQPPMTPSTGGLFGSTNQNALMHSAPPSTSGLGNLKASSAQLYRRPIMASSEISIQDRILKIYAGWNVSDPRCQFQHFFYNVVAPEQVHMYGRPSQLAPDDPRWQRAKRNNPDPSRLVPTLAIGFEDLSKRVVVQKNQAQVHLAKLQEISSRLDELTRKHNIETNSRLHKLKSDQAMLSTRMLSLVSKLGSTVGLQQQHQATSEREEELIERIKRLKAALEEGGKAKVAELWAGVSQLKSVGGPVGIEGAGKWSVIDEREIKKVLEVLMNQQKGIDHLMLLLRKSRADVTVMRQAFDLESNSKVVEW